MNTKSLTSYKNFVRITIDESEKEVPTWRN